MIDKLAYLCVKTFHALVYPAIIFTVALIAVCELGAPEVICFILAIAAWGTAIPLGASALIVVACRLVYELRSE